MRQTNFGLHVLMLRHPCKLTSVELPSCFCIVFQLSDQRCRIDGSISYLVANRSYRRTYCNQVLFERASKKFVANNKFFNHPFRRYSSQTCRSDETYSVLQTDGFQHWFKNWQELRKHKLTASTFGQAVGFWRRRRVQLWLEKLGAIEPFSGNFATCWSNIKEEEALERYKLITGNTVFFPEFQVHGKMNPEDDWLAASPDGIVDRLVYGLPSQGVLEIKCPFFKGDMTVASPWKRIPVYCIPQAQGLMEILDRDWMDFYVWTPVGSSLFRLYRDVEYWNLLKMALSDFWWKHVQPARELMSQYEITDVVNQLKPLVPEPRHELCTAIVHESIKIADSSTLLMREIGWKLQG